MSGDASPLVSVVVLTWNRRPLLEQALTSVLAQSSADLEVLVVDNESTDDTGAYASAHPDPRVRYFRNANGGNLSVNRNFAIARARGAWVAFCDDDDVWDADKLRRQLAEASARPGVGVVCSNAVYFSVAEDGAVTEYGTLLPEGPDRDLGLEEMLRGRNEVVLSSAMVRREVLEDVGEWDVDPGIFAIEDYQYWIRAAARGHRIRRIGEPLLRYRVHSAMVSHADTRVTQRKQLYMIERLHERGVLDAAAYARARRAFRARARKAAVKEALKRVPGLKAAVYDSRSRRFSAGRVPRSSDGLER